MNLDDLMEVWKSQDALPLHGTNEALLRLALRQDETKLKKSRRRETWITCGVAALTIALLMRLLLLMIHRHDGNALSGWDYAIPVVGGVAALLWASRWYVRRRAQAVREQRFGESLRDQINRQLAQCDYAATRTRPASWLGLRLLFIVSLMAMAFARGRINDWTFNNIRLWGPIVFWIFWVIITFGASSWAGRLLLQRKILPRKRHLEELLKELDDQ